MNRTLILLKPDCVYRGLCSELLACFESDFCFERLELIYLTDEQATALYGKYSDRDFFEPLREYMMSGPCIAVVLAGKDAVTRVRHKALQLRDKHKVDFRRNTIHSSDSPQAAEREIRIIFGD